ncbi:MAG: TatD family hydrolase [Bacteroidaceae bacterium]|nr:TatD family hydrolase [Bacteroidaceae bacterium]
MKLIDTHCHVYDEAFREDMPQVIKRATDAGLELLLLPNINPDTLPDLLNACSLWPDLCRPMIGLHPEDLSDDFHSQLSELKSILDRDQADSGLHQYIGIGETGLDLYWDKSRLDDQIESFRIQIEWALEYDLPIVIHSRDSFTQLYKVMSDYRDSGLRGVFHCFSGNAQEAQALMEFGGFMFGIGGVLTFKKSTLPDVLSQIPLSKVVLETDCPYLAPVPMRGKRNEPSFLPLVAERAAQVYGLPVDQIAQITNANARTLFRL